VDSDTGQGLVLDVQTAPPGLTWATQVAVGTPASGYTLTNALYGTVGPR